jgi:hypothetical protein
MDLKTLAYCTVTEIVDECSNEPDVAETVTT